MLLEKEINMDMITDIKLRAYLELIFTSAAIHHRHLKFLDPFEISPQQYNILRILRGSHPIKLSVMDIKSRMLDKTPNTTRLVDKLLKKHFVSRERGQKDRRQIFVGITEKGLDIMNDLDKINPKFLNFMNNLSDEECRELSALLEKMRM